MAQWEVMVDIYQKKIQAEIASRGLVSFADFMQLALYMPEAGYYMRPKEIFGLKGDFYTSAQVSSYFGYTLAKQFDEIWRLLGEPDNWQLVEWGPGQGGLAKDILVWLRDNSPKAYDGLRYCLLEISPTLRGQQQKLLKDLQETGEIVWISDMEEANPNGGGVIGCVFSNELIDAFPVHRVKFSQGKWKEVYVFCEQNRLWEKEGPLSQQELGIYIEKTEFPWEEGQVLEINLAAQNWLSTVSNAMQQGIVITIDYGGKAWDIWGSRPQGSLRCYQQHQLIQDPFLCPGDCDITCHVDFSSLINWGEQCGLAFAGYTQQAKFLLNLGILNHFQKEKDFSYSAESIKDVMAIKKLIMPEGMGAIYKVLAQYKGLRKKPSLQGFTRNF